jgi:replicative DNA helicase
MFFSMEQSSIYVFERFMQMAGSMEGREVERWMQPNDDAHNSKIFATAQHLTSKLKNLLVCDQSGMSISAIEAHARQAGFAYFGRPVGVIYIDYLGYVQGDGKTTYEIVSNIARQQKALAKNLNCVVVSLHQVTKSIGQGDEVYESDARDSSAIRDSADILVTAWRPEMKRGILDQEKLEKRGLWCSNIRKNRYGPSNELVNLMFVPQFYQLHERLSPALEAALRAKIGGQPALPMAAGFSWKDAAAGGGF